MHSPSIKAIIASAATVLSLSAMAADPQTDTLTPQQQAQQHERDLKTDSKAQYKARKDLADVNKDLEIADCKTAGLDSKDLRDCKRDAKDNAKAAKESAKEVYKEEKANIKANTQ